MSEPEPKIEKVKGCIAKVCAYDRHTKVNTERMRVVWMLEQNDPRVPKDVSIFYVPMHDASAAKVREDLSRFHVDRNDGPAIGREFTINCTISFSENKIRLGEIEVNRATRSVLPFEYDKAFSDSVGKTPCPIVEGYIDSRDGARHILTDSLFLTVDGLHFLIAPFWINKYYGWLL